MTQTRRNCSSSFLCRQGECLNSVSAHPSNWTGNADSGGNLPAFVQNWSRNTSRPKVCLLIVHREALLRDSRKLFPKTREIWDGVRSCPLECQHGEDFFALLAGEKRQQDLAQRRAIWRTVHSRPGGHTKG